MRLARLLSVLAVPALLLAGCSSGNNEVAPTSTTSSSSAKPSPSRVLLAVLALGILLLLAALAGLVYVLTTDLFSWLAVVLGVVVLLTTMNVFVARATEKFAWYGIAVFFSVLVFGATVTIAKDLDRPSAQPIALVRKSDAVGICGVFITQTSDRVYVGRSALIDSESKKP